MKFAPVAVAASIAAVSGIILSADSARADGVSGTRVPAQMLQSGMSGRDWTGPYLAVGISGTMVSFSSDNALTPSSASDVGGSVKLGFNLQDDSIVYGGELLANVSNIRGTSSGCGLGATFTCRSKVDNYLAVRVRVGLSMGDTLVFGTLGVATDMQDQEIRDGGVLVGQDKARHYGPIIGIGVEHALNDNWGVRGDLEHFRLNTRSYDLAVPGAISIRAKQNAARLSIVNRF